MIKLFAKIAARLMVPVQDFKLAYRQEVIAYNIKRARDSVSSKKGRS